MASFDERLEVLTSRYIDQMIADTSQTLLAGQLQSHADYRYQCGIIEGLRRAKELVAGALTDIQKG